ncbi:hypothetical protein HPB51_003329 [Rhipicephalus microplus]|uniref:Monocarboxylate transporter n=1 Tax=Rhipicephalus microplus TaxID=6941 RepID=A0A9J6EWS8_RHIMP|nr:hypothetical protein HPB51_003329 [Rhipicephalus microplus]
MSPPAHVLDRCWGVPVVAFFSAFVVFMPAFCGGMVYVLLMDEFGISHEMAAWPQSTFMVMSNTIGLVQSVLQPRVPLYYLTLFGVALACIGLVASAFSPDIKWMAALYGGVYGAGAGFCIINISLYLLLYFDKYRATATASKYIGVAVSGIVGPTLLSCIANKYGTRGVFLLVGAMALHAVPLVMLLADPRPITIPPWCFRPPVKDSTAPTTQYGGQHSAGGGQPTREWSRVTGRPMRRNNMNEDYSNDPLAKKTASEMDVIKHEDGVILVIKVTSLDVPNLCSVNSTPPGNCQIKPASAKHMSVESLSLLGHYATLLRTPLFYVLLMAFVEIEYTMVMVNTTIVEYAIDKGTAALKDAKQLQTYQALGELAGRIVVPIISDKIANSRSPITAVSLALKAGCLLVIVHVNHFGTLAGLAVLAGVCEGYLMCVKFVLIGDYFGVENLGAVSGLLGVASVPALLSGPSIIGFFRDKLRSYDKFYWLLAAVSLMSACLVGSIAAKDTMQRKAWDIGTTKGKTDWTDCGDSVRR